MGTVLENGECFENFFDRHGITPAIAEGRYVEYRKGDPDGVVAAYHAGFDADVQRLAKKVASQADSSFAATVGPRHALHRCERGVAPQRRISTAHTKRPARAFTRIPPRSPITTPQA